jgi:dipeptidyl aminopeptidase/acylaminoacyl peptidase
MPLSDDAIRRALRPEPHVVAPPSFADTVAQQIATHPQHRRRWSLGVQARSRTIRLAGRVLLLLVVLLALIIGAIVVGSLRERPAGGGPLFLAQGNELSMIDPRTGGMTRVVDEPGGVFGVARSTGGELVSFWTGSPQVDLELVRADGSGRRRLATNLIAAPMYGGGIDVWSTDDRHLASWVSVGGINRILVVDVVSGDGFLVGPDDGATNPLWSPDGEWIAFTHQRTDRPDTLAIMRRDGSDLRDLTLDLDAYVSGPDNWSSDGRWIYFDAGQRSLESASVYRVDADTALVEQLTHGQAAAAPALSPDDTQVAFLIWTFARNDTLQAVFVMAADGSRPHLLVQDADLRGWSPDSRYVLVVEQTPDEPVELLAITPDSSERRVLLTLDSCTDPCLGNISWGWPRP